MSATPCVAGIHHGRGNVGGPAGSPAGPPPGSGLTRPRMLRRRYGRAVSGSGDGGERRGSGAWSWWVWQLGGFVVTLAALVLLGTVFPVAAVTMAGYGAGLGASGLLRPNQRRTRGAWLPVAVLSPLMVGLGLLLGAAGLDVDAAHPAAAGSGALLGSVLVLVSVATLVVALFLRRRVVVALAITTVALWVVAVAVPTTIVIAIDRLPGADPGRSGRALVLAMGAFVTVALPAVGASIGLVVARRTRRHGRDEIGASSAGDLDPSR